MTYKELYIALDQLSSDTERSVCLGCDYENRCSLTGCAISRTAIAAIQQLRVQNQRLATALEEAKK